MAENSKIEWTDHTFNPCGSSRWLRVSPEAGLVRKAVASLAKGNAVPHIKAQFGKLGEWSNVVGVQISAPVVTTVCAGESVAQVDLVSPAFQFGGMAQAAPFNSLAVDISRSFGTTKGLGARFFADFFARFQRQFNPPSPAWFAEMGATYLGPRILAVRLALEGARPSLCAFTCFDTVALEARRGFAIMSRCIASISAAFLPRLAFGAAFQTACQALTEFVNGQATLLRGNFQCTFGGLGHGRH